MPPREVRGTWLDPRAYQDPDTRVKTLRLITQAHLNTLFILAPLNDDDAPFAEAVPSCLMATSTPPRRLYLPWILRSFP